MITNTIAMEYRCMCLYITYLTYGTQLFAVRRTERCRPTICFSSSSSPSPTFPATWYPRTYSVTLAQSCQSCLHAVSWKPAMTVCCFVVQPLTYTLNLQLVPIVISGWIIVLLPYSLNWWLCAEVILAAEICEQYNVLYNIMLRIIYVRLMCYV